MSKYILDTNIVSYFTDDLSPLHTTIVKKISQLGNQDNIYLSILTIYELEHGIASMNNDMAVKFTETKNMMTENFEILPLSLKGPEIFGILKTGYRKQTGITKEAVKKHDIDFMIASSAIAENAILVSNDKIFNQFKNIHPKFLLENWTE